VLVDYKGERFILTNHHVLESDKIAEGATAYFDYERLR
jgi:hypothetical protein